MGNLVSQTMSQIGDVVQCYKTGNIMTVHILGHLIGASPQAQFLANVIGTCIGIGYVLNNQEYLPPSEDSFYSLSLRRVSCNTPLLMIVPLKCHLQKLGMSWAWDCKCLASYIHAAFQASRLGQINAIL